MLQGIILGKLIDDPTQETVKDQWIKVKATLSVRTGEKKKDGEQYAPSRLIRLEAWGKTGERLMNHTKKGDQLWAAGKLKLDPVKDGKGYWVGLNLDDWGYAGSRDAKPAQAEPREADYDADEIPF